MKRIFKMIITIVFFITSLFFVACDNVPNGYTAIKTPEDLVNIKNDLSGKYILINDIDLDGNEWEPIGTDDNPFSGILSGNGHIISNMTITSNENDCIGLFGFATDTKITNLNLKNIDITLYTNPLQMFYVGSLIGRSTKNIDISDCEVSGSIRIESQSGVFGSSYTGGLIGVNINSLEITNCYNNTDIFLKVNSGSRCSYAGGLVGADDGIVTIGKSYNSGNITVTDNLGSIATGGLVGTSRDSISIDNSYNNGHINATTTDPSRDIYAGGLIGQCNNFIIKNSYNSGESTIVSNSSTTFMGGLIGFSVHGIFENCLSLGVLSGDITGIMNAGFTDIMLTNSYYYNITADYYNNAIEVTLDQLNTKSFYADIFGWDISIWDFSNLDFNDDNLPKYN